jgi:hypothetical protein|tara:strand:+ start:845 stop:1249 length:405 start_codon:yes stop_codon:yes gene_type:complete
MKKLKMLIFLMMTSWSCFSQIAIDSISIQLEKPIAKLIIKDLLIGDSYRTELSLVNTKINLLEQKVFLKDSIIFSLNTKSSNFENILYTKQDQLSISQELTRNLQTDLKKQKLKTKLFGGTGILIAAGVIFILK